MGSSRVRGSMLAALAAALTLTAPGITYGSASSLPRKEGTSPRPGPEVQPGVPAVLVASQPEFPSPANYSSQRRLTLARWIAATSTAANTRIKH